MAELIQTNERVSWLVYPPEEELDADLRKLFAKARQNLGFVPNVFVTYMTRPGHFRHWFNHFRELMNGESELSQAEREMISVVVSAQNGCLYCLVSHGAELRRLLNDEVLGDRITFDYRRAGLDARTTAMLDFVVKLTKTPVACEEADLDRLRGHGFSEEAIFDIAEVTAMFNFTNRLASATGMLPNREYHGIGRSHSNA
ncbi:MAG TPA: peroxidase-related enzyme [Caldilineaceae bacterium]|nr:peroxidase-related enzyme [Caldilineaceae bacterium]